MKNIKVDIKRYSVIWALCVVLSGAVCFFAQANNSDTKQDGQALTSVQQAKSHAEVKLINLVDTPHSALSVAPETKPLADAPAFQPLTWRQKIVSKIESVLSSAKNKLYDIKNSVAAHPLIAGAAAASVSAILYAARNPTASKLVEQNAKESRDGKSSMPNSGKSAQISNNSIENNQGQSVKPGGNGKSTASQDNNSSTASEDKDVQSNNNKPQNTQLMIALKEGRTQEVKELAKAFIGKYKMYLSIDQDNADGLHGFTALVLAAHYGCEDVVKMLLDRGADILATTKNSGGLTPLLCAAGGGNTKVVKLLLKKMKKSKSPVKDYSSAYEYVVASGQMADACAHACKAGRLEVIRILLPLCITEQAGDVQMRHWCGLVGQGVEEVKDVEAVQAGIKEIMQQKVQGVLLLGHDSAAGNGELKSDEIGEDSNVGKNKNELETALPEEDNVPNLDQGDREHKKEDVDDQEHEHVREEDPERGQVRVFTKKERDRFLLPNSQDSEYIATLKMSVKDAIEDRMGLEMVDLRTGYFLLHDAVRKGTAEGVALLIQCGANVNGRSTVNSDVQGTVWVGQEKTPTTAMLPEMCTPLHYACEENIDQAKEKIKLLLLANADVNAKNVRDETPLLVTTNVDIAKILIEAGADINAYGRTGGVRSSYMRADTALVGAIKRSDQEMVECLCAVKNNDGSAKIKCVVGGESALEYAYEGMLGSSGEKRPKSKRILDTVISISTQKDCDAVDSNNKTVLARAYEDGEWDVIMALCAQGANPNASVEKKDEYGYRYTETLLMSAIDRRDVALVECLCDVKDNQGNVRIILCADQQTGLGLGKKSALNVAYTCMKDAISDEQLIKSKAILCKIISVSTPGDCDLEASYNRKTVLNMAFEDGEWDVVKALAIRGANPHVLVQKGNKEDGFYTETPLMWALKNEDQGLAKALINTPHSGLNVQDHMGKTALHYAVLKNNKEAVQLLIAAADTDINAVDIQGKTALMVACSQGYEDIFQEIMQHAQNNPQIKEQYVGILHETLKELGVVGCVREYMGDLNIDKQDVRGYTALYYAAHFKAADGQYSPVSKRMIDALVKHGADCNKQYVTGGAVHDSRHAEQKHVWSLMKHAVCEIQDVDMVKMLCEKNVRVGADEMALLMQEATKQQNQPIIDLLQERLHKQREQLFEAIECEQDEKEGDERVQQVLDVLIRERSGNPLGLKDADGNTVLHEAILKGCSRKVVESLVNKRAIVDTYNKSKQSTLMLALQRQILSEQDIIEVLVPGYFDPYARDNNGCTALAHAAANGCACVVAELVKGANYQDYKPLIEAARHGHTEILMTLLQQYEIRNHDNTLLLGKLFDGVSLLTCAADKGYADMVTKVKEYAQDKMHNGKSAWECLKDGHHVDIAFQNALEGAHTKIIKVLLPDMVNQETGDDQKAKWLAMIPAENNECREHVRALLYQEQNQAEQ